jgi:hypothetical protein
MSNLPKEWRFLRAAWVYALVLTGREHAATGMVANALQDIANRHDVVSTKRRRRLFFAMLFREGEKKPRGAGGGSANEDGLAVFHRLEEPGRSAISLLYLHLFPAEEIADILGTSEKELAGILTRARAELSGNLSVPQ